MDESRVLDLKRLDGVINDPLKSNSVRLRADRAKQCIIAQSKDRKLLDMREELIRATRAHDESTALKIEMRIKSYTKETWDDYLPK